MHEPSTKGARDGVWHHRALFFFFEILVAVSGAVILRAQTIIENPSTPLAENPGRTLKLREIWRITDKEGSYYFKSPHNLQLGDDGSIFIADKEQILRFDSNGNFHKNLYKKGQGPGEISDSFTYLIHRGVLYVKDYRQMRIFRMDSEGSFIDQLSLEIGRMNLCDVREDGYILMRVIWPSQDVQTGKLLALPHQISFVSFNEQIQKDLHTFRPRWFMTPKVQKQWDPDIIVIDDDGRHLFGCHSEEYLIEILDLNAGKIIKSFRRKYPRVRKRISKEQEELQKAYGLSESTYEWDISNLFVNEKELWVQTSTKSAENGILFDVFNTDGCFMDSFYPGHDRSLLKVRDNNLFVLEKDVEGTYSIVKYLIQDRNQND